MGKIKMWLYLCGAAAGIIFVNPLEVRAEEITVELNVEYEDIMFHGDETQGEYGVIHGTNSSGEVLWEIKTDTYPRTQYDSVTEIGQNNGLYYYEEGGILKAIKVKNGKRKWKVPGCGVISDFEFDSRDTLFFCSSEGPDFEAVDRNGRVLKRIEHLDENVYWPYQIECLENNQVAITFEGCAEEYDRYREDGSGGIIFLIDMKDGSYSMENKEINLELWKERYYVNENDMLGTPLKYAYIDMENDGQDEVLVCTEDSEGTTGLYLWSKNQGQYTCGSEFKNILKVKKQDWDFFYSPTYQELVMHSKNEEGENYFFYKIENSYWKLDFSVFYMDQPDKTRTIFFSNAASESLQTIAEYNYEKNSSEKENGLKVWESYIGDLILLKFQNF